MSHALPGGVVRLCLSKVASELLHIAVQGGYEDRQSTGTLHGHFACLHSHLAQRCEVAEKQLC